MSTKVVFESFPRLSPGDDCEGASFFIEGDPAVCGYIYRNVEWKDVGTTSCRYGAPKIRGYGVALYGEFATEEEPHFETLKEARDFVRSTLLGKGKVTS